MEYYYEDELIYSDPNLFSYYSESIVLICPFCLNYCVLSRDSPNAGYINETSEFFYCDRANCSDNFPISNKEEFDMHVLQCQKALEIDGMYKVSSETYRDESDIHKKHLEMAVRFAFISKVETKYKLQLNLSSFHYYNPIAYILIYENRPVAYVLCYPFKFEKENVLTIANIYTIPKYRKKGFQTRLLNHVISNEQLTKLLVSTPLSDAGKKFFYNFGKNQTYSIIYLYDSNSNSVMSLSLDALLIPDLVI